MATYVQNQLGADELQNLWANKIPTSLTVTPWQCKLAQKIFSVTGDKKMKSFNGAQGWNTWIIDQMFKHYQTNKSAQYIQEKTKVSADVASSFVSNINGYKGQDVREGLAAKAVDLVGGGLDLAKGLGEGLEDTAKGIPLVVILLAAGVAGYLIFAGRKGVNLVPQIPFSK